MTAESEHRRHLLGLEGLSAGEITSLLDEAESYCPIAAGDAPSLDSCAGRIVANLFFEPSTRTRCSFAVAARRLGAETIDLTATGSSISKGETLTDTARTIAAMGVDAMIIRAKPAGSPALIAKAVACPVINAGDGRHEHPTQGLLDALSLRQRLGDLAGKSIAIVGDILNSRVARSDIFCLTTLGINLTLIGPPTLVSDSLKSITPAGDSLTISHELDAALPTLDAIMMLRVQRERAAGGAIASDYRQSYGLTVQRAARLKPEAIILHPGPMNRGVEIDAEVADDPQRSVIIDQVTNGVAVRMAVLRRVLKPGRAPG